VYLITQERIRRTERLERRCIEGIREL
jgi:hypothetical protein